MNRILKKYGYAPDKLEAIAIIGFSERPGCVVPNYEKPLQLNVGETAQVWIKLVSSTNVAKPLSDRPLTVDVVDGFGEISEGLFASPTSSTSGADGFAVHLVTLNSKSIGVYRIRVIYSDLFSENVSYSPPIIILDQKGNSMSPIN